jgi:hypothetical protein
MNKAGIGINDFWLGVISGALAAIIIFSVILGLTYFNKRDKEILEYAEKQIELQELREDYRNRDAVELLDDIPGVRRAAAEFDRKRDEALERIRNRPLD